MTGTGTNEWATDEVRDHPTLRYAAVVFTKAFVTGAIGGLATFVYSQSELMAVSIDPISVLGLAALAGAASHLLSRSLRESIHVGLAGLVSGSAVLILVWIAPLWILPYSAGARDILLPKLAGQALTATMIVYMAAYLGAYLTVLCLDAVRH